MSDTKVFEPRDVAKVFEPPLPCCGDVGKHCPAVYVCTSQVIRGSINCREFWDSVESWKKRSNGKSV